MTNKPKRLTLEEKKFIEDHVVQAEWTDERMANELGRDIDTIRRYRKQIGVLKSGRGKTHLDPDAQNHGITNLNNISDIEKQRFIQTQFKTLPRYHRLQKIMTKEDLDYFVYEWARMSIQFDDMKPSEEDTLEHLIVCKMRMDDNRRSYKLLQEQAEEINRQIKDKPEGLDPQNNPVDQMLFETSLSVNRQTNDLNKDWRELSDKYEKYTRALNATREQREQSQKIGGNTFLTLVENLTNEELRKSVSNWNERMRISTEEKTKKLKEPVQFEDGVIEPILLDGEDYV